MLQRVAVCCSVLQCVAVCCKRLKGANWSNVVRKNSIYGDEDALGCSVLRCVAVCCRRESG